MPVRDGDAQRPEGIAGAYGVVEGADAADGLVMEEVDFTLLVRVVGVFCLRLGLALALAVGWRMVRTALHCTALYRMTSRSLEVPFASGLPKLQGWLLKTVSGLHAIGPSWARAIFCTATACCRPHFSPNIFNLQR